MRDLFGVVESVAAAGGRAVVMTYWNPVLRYGVDAFARDLAAAGGLGVITPDLVPDEAADWIAASDAHGLDRIFLVAPSSTEERIGLTAPLVARLPLRDVGHGRDRGARRRVAAPRRRWCARVREHTVLPIGVGLGVRSGAQAAEVAGVRRRRDRGLGLRDRRRRRGLSEAVRDAHRRPGRMASAAAVTPA